MRGFLQSILSFLLPWACAGCQKPLGTVEDTGYCAACWLHLPRLSSWICRLCGVSLPEGGGVCFRCRTEPPPVLVRAAAAFQGPISRGLHRFKYGGRKSLGRAFGILLRYAWTQYGELQSTQLLVPVPLHPRHARQRGYNQALVLAEALSPLIERPVLPLLRRPRATKSQTRLTRTERKANVQAAFQIDPDFKRGISLLRNRPILLIDDVCTTASTLSACAKVLRRAGLGPVSALVLARDL